MFKRYFDFLADRFIELYQAANTTEEYLSEYIDKIIVWVVSLSTGSIVLLISYADKIGLSKFHINTTLLLLLFSVITGFLGRLLHFEAVKAGKEFLSMFQFEMKLSQFQYYPREIRDEDTAGSIYHYINDDFDFPLKEYAGISSKDEFLKKYTLIEAKKLYEAIKLSCAENMQIAKSEVNKVIDRTFQKDDGSKLKPNKQPTELQVAHKIRFAKIFQLSCIICFVLALVTVSVFYMIR